MTSITTIADTTTLFSKLLHGLRTWLEFAGSSGLPEEEPASGLSPRLSYDVGLSDLCPDRMVRNRSAEASGEYGRELMRRGF